MLLGYPRRPALAVALILALGCPCSVAPAEAQFLKRFTQAAACAGGAFAGAKLGETVAEYEAKRLKLSPQEANKRKRAFQIGLALALCGGGAAIAGTTYSKLSKRGQEARQKEVLAALEDAQPHTYVDPDNPSVTGTATAQPTFVQGDEECRIVEDHLPPDQAYVKYCRPPNGMWSVKAV
jgi:hypothetical protein